MSDKSDKSDKLDRAFEALFALNYEDEKRRLLLSEARLALASIRALDQMDERQ